MGLYGNVEDSLIAHHSFASHLPKRLDWLVSEYCDSAPWKIVHGRRGGEGAAEEKGSVKHMPGLELARYNAADCLLTNLCWARMAGNAEEEWAVYQEDKQLAFMCAEMSSSGIGVDLSRKIQLSREMRTRALELKVSMRRLLRWGQFQPSRLPHVREALFERLGAKKLGQTPGGMPSTDNSTLERYKSDDTEVGKFATLLLDWRAIVKVRSTYVGSDDWVDRPLKFDAVMAFGRAPRAHFAWKPFGTVSGRLSCRLQSCPRYKPGVLDQRVREIYVPRLGHTFVYFDVSQAEMRIAAYLSGDENFIASAKSSDMHLGNARNLFPDIAARGWFEGDAVKDPARGKPFRDISKNFGFAICYLAEAEAVHANLVRNGFTHVRFQLVQVWLARLRAQYKRYFQYVEANVNRVKECGFMRVPVGPGGVISDKGRLRWFGHWPKATEVGNTPVQGSLAAIMNARTLELRARGLSPVSQIHDACIYEVPNRKVGVVKRMIADAWAPEVDMPGGKMKLPIELKSGERWSDL